MRICDMHCDSLIRVGETRRLITDYNFSSLFPHLQFAAAFIPAKERAPEDRRAELMRHFSAFEKETASLDVERVSDLPSLHSALSEKKHAAMFSVEGGGGLFADSPELAFLSKNGLRVLGMAWDDNELAASAFGKDGDFGLTAAGADMVKRCEVLGITQDVSHLSDKSFFDLCSLTDKPILATHSDFRSVVNHPRNLTDEMAKEIARRGGLIGINLCIPFLSGKDTAGEADFLRQIDFGLSLVGEDAVGFGFDIDGIDHYPDGFLPEGSIHDKAFTLLSKHYSPHTVEKICGGNVISVLEKIWFNHKFCEI